MEDKLNNFICRKCKQEFYTGEKGMHLCMRCFKILRHQFEKIQQLKNQSMMWKCHSNTIAVDKSSKSSWDDDIVLCD
jgi:hypothetical protein